MLHLFVGISSGGPRQVQGLTRIKVLIVAISDINAALTLVLPRDFDVIISTTTRFSSLESGCSGCLSAPSLSSARRTFGDFQREEAGSDPRESTPTVQMVTGIM
jgi:hypothetical protein